MSAAHLARGRRRCAVAAWRYYYLRVVKVMYFDEPIDLRPLEAVDVRALL
jgi:NADH:ubiquinone oxidoreductase subunit 2 (subunit N)